MIQTPRVFNVTKKTEFYYSSNEEFIFQIQSANRIYCKFILNISYLMFTLINLINLIFIVKSIKSKHKF